MAAAAFDAFGVGDVFILALRQRTSGIRPNGSGSRNVRRPAPGYRRPLAVARGFEPYEPGLASTLPQPLLYLIDRYAWSDDGVTGLTDEAR